MQDIIAVQFKPQEVIRSERFMINVDYSGIASRKIRSQRLMTKASYSVGNIGNYERMTCASTVIKLTISPTVVPCRAVLLSRRTCMNSGSREGAVKFIQTIRLMNSLNKISITQQGEQQQLYKNMQGYGGVKSSAQPRYIAQSRNFHETDLDGMQSKIGIKYTKMNTHWVRTKQQELTCCFKFI